MRARRAFDVSVRVSFREAAVHSDRRVVKSLRRAVGKPSGLRLALRWTTSSCKARRATELSIAPRRASISHHEGDASRRLHKFRKDDDCDGASAATHWEQARLRHRRIAGRGASARDARTAGRAETAVRPAGRARNQAPEPSGTRAEDEGGRGRGDPAAPAGRGERQGRDIAARGLRPEAPRDAQNEPDALFAARRGAPSEAEVLRAYVARRGDGDRRTCPHARSARRRGRRATPPRSPARRSAHAQTDRLGARDGGARGG